MLTRPQLLNAGVGPDTVDGWIKAGRLIRWLGRVEVTARTRRRRPGVIVHESNLVAHGVTRRWGVPTTSPAAVNDARVAHLLSLDDVPAKLEPGQTPTGRPRT